MENDAEAMLLWCQDGAGIECRLAEGEKRLLASGQGLLLEGQRGSLALHAPQPALLYLGWLYREG